jgi:NhaP-type Na+/H+ or K+/H+ antiporter
MFCLLQLGADEKLSSLIDAESLVNDGSTFSIFLVLQGIVGGKWLSANEVSAQQ